MTDDNVTPFPQRPAEDEAPPPHLWENPSVPEAMQVLMEWTAWRIRAGDSPPTEYYRLHQLRDALCHLEPRLVGGIEVNLP